VDISQFDFNDKSSRTDSARIANGILIGLVVVVICLRLFSRLKFLKRIFVDDSKCLATWLCSKADVVGSPNHHRCCVYFGSCVDEHCRYVGYRSLRTSHSDTKSSYTFRPRNSHLAASLGHAF
jgi:hypothetical protein